ncbi:DUF1850 domain-containing protein, partial [Pyramidobacter piscolens]|uniref:DUF1850 domain-containing protein n=2 Tax=Pyramidobacter piscolens TaxID=638849 RepID=UPI002665ED13
RTRGREDVNMKKSLGRVSLFIFSLVAVAGILFCVPQQYLTVTDERGAVVYLRPVKLGERYTVRFIHSVARRPVDEIYEIAPDCSILRETVYDMMGAGLPTGPLDGQTFTVEDGAYRIRGFHLRLPAVTYRISKVAADHTLFVGTDEFKLKQWVSAPGKPLTFSVHEGNLSELLKFKCRNMLWRV